MDRYGMNNWGAIDKRTFGSYVLYTDHLAAIDEKDTEIDKWVALYRKQSTEIEQLKHKIYMLQGRKEDSDDPAV